MDYNLEAIARAAKDAGASLVGRPDKWNYELEPTIVCEVTFADCLFFVDDKGDHRALYVELMDSFGHDLSLIAPAYLRTALLKAVDIESLRPYLENPSKPWELFKSTEEPSGDVCEAVLESFKGAKLIIAYHGLGDAKTGETAPHLFRVWTLALDSDLGAVRGTIDEAVALANAGQSAEVSSSILSREGL